jgi:hypothetical protein
VKALKNLNNKNEVLKETIAKLAGSIPLQTKANIDVNKRRLTNDFD